jgi:hypothetical protein
MSRLVRRPEMRDRPRRVLPGRDLQPSDSPRPAQTTAAPDAKENLGAIENQEKSVWTDDSCGEPG